MQTSRLSIKDSSSREPNEMIGKAFTDRFVYEVEQDMAVLNDKKHLPGRGCAREMGPSHSSASMPTSST